MSFTRRPKPSSNITLLCKQLKNDGNTVSPSVWKVSQGDAQMRVACGTGDILGIAGFGLLVEFNLHRPKPQHSTALNGSLDDAKP